MASRDELDRCALADAVRNSPLPCGTEWHWRLPDGREHVGGDVSGASLGGVTASWLCCREPRRVNARATKKRGKGVDLHGYPCVFVAIFGAARSNPGSPNRLVVIFGDLRLGRENTLETLSIWAPNEALGSH